MFLKDSAMESANFLMAWRCQVFWVKIFFQLIYEEVSIYSKYYKPHSLLKVVKMWQKVDVLENVWDGERHFFFEVKDQYKVSCVKILIFWYITRRLAFV